MGDVIAEPVFGEPRDPGILGSDMEEAERLACSCWVKSITMEAMGGFLSVGTQMKIEGRERPAPSLLV